MNIINGKELSIRKSNELKDKIKNFSGKPSLAIFLVGNDESSKIYVRNKIKKMDELGIKSKLFFNEETTTEEMIQQIEKLNEDESINGIMVQLPLPNNINENKVVNTIKKSKDIDGLRDDTISSIKNGDDVFLPATVGGVLEIFREYNVDIKNKNVVIIGKSRIIGYPLGLVMMNLGSNVTWLVKGDSLDKTKNADILIVAAGNKHLIKNDDVKSGVIIIDVGITRINKKIYGDVDFDNVKSKASLITPVPGGVGPMTIYYLMKNIVNSYEKD
ncbi:MAG: bifunctional 5,10-methylenetetrahydrofolate dehydrogenase/5,10-methenyltetrahydrofolate cyclohydrolase [Mycoplasma sp.]|nr:bifunctional 5,10-methylenetetrahydrofolate dehydrogenase/5,10-methenyltetrahydrofolate cyclohydrolase [Mycoplasma sp.]